jgi:hypothetical protein
MQLKKVRSLNIKLVISHAIAFLISLGVEKIIVRLGLGLERGKGGSSTLLLTYKVWKIAKGGAFSS